MSGRCWRPARGLRAAADAGCERAFVCAVDMPFMTVELIDELVGAALRSWAPTWCCRGMAAITIWPGCTAPSLADRVDALVAAGERSMRALVDTVDTQRIVMAEQRVADEREHRRPIWPDPVVITLRNILSKLH